VRRGRDCPAYVAQPQFDAELVALRQSVERGVPYGGERWQKRTMAQLGLESALCPRGRQTSQKMKPDLFSPVTMTRKNRIRADQLLAQLQTDPEYLRIRREREEYYRRLQERYAELDRPILESLSATGFPAQSIEDLVKKYAPLPRAVVAILLHAIAQSIEQATESRHCESLVRALGAAKEPFDGTVLATCYDNTSDESLRWAIANTIAIVKATSIDQWIQNCNSQLKSNLEKLGYYSDGK
jgi:hypothetical protein